MFLRCFVVALRISSATFALIGPGWVAKAHTPLAANPAIAAGAAGDSQLVAAAKKEGQVTVYSSLTTKDMSGLIAAFVKKYAISVNFWRGSSEDIRDRAIAEARNNRFDVDVVETAGPDMVAMDRTHLFSRVRSSLDSDLIAQAVRPDRNWTGSRITVVVGAYNTDEIKDPPKNYDDLLKPRYKGDLAIEAEADWWLMALADAWGEQKAVSFFKTMVARNGVSARKGHTLLANLTASGETPIALTTYSYKVDQLMRQGAPIKRIDWSPMIADMTGIGIASKAPHPNAALLFRRFFLTDGQAILAKLDAVPVNKKYLTLPPGLQLTFTNPSQWLDQDKKWSALYRSLFVTQAN